MNSLLEVTNSELAALHPMFSGAHPFGYDWEARYERLAAVCKPDTRSMQYTVSVFDLDFPEIIVHVGSDRVRALLVLEDLTHNLADGGLRVRLTQQARK